MAVSSPSYALVDYFPSTSPKRSARSLLCSVLSSTSETVTNYWLLAWFERTNSGCLFASSSSCLFHSSSMSLILSRSCSSSLFLISSSRLALPRFTINSTNCTPKPMIARITDFTRALGPRWGSLGDGRSAALCQRDSRSAIEYYVVDGWALPKLIPNNNLSTNLMGPNMLFKLNTFDMIYLVSLYALYKS